MHVRGLTQRRCGCRDPESVLGDLDIDQATRDEILSNIRHRLTPQPIKFRADVDVSCFKYEGIDAVKRALKKGIITEGEESVKVRLPSFHAPCPSCARPP